MIRRHALVRAARTFNAIVNAAVTVPGGQDITWYGAYQILIGVGLACSVVAGVTHPDADLDNRRRQFAGVVVRPIIPTVVVINTARIGRGGPLVIVLVLDKFLDAGRDTPNNVRRVIVIFGDIKGQGVSHGMQFGCGLHQISPVTVLWHGDGIG